MTTTLRRLTALGLSAMLASALVGQAVRDRSAALALLLYLPVLPLGLVALAFDLACRGRAWPRPRFALGVLGAVGLVAGLLPMVGLGAGRTSGPGEPVTVVQWNVQWGGGKARSPATWAAQRAAIVARRADLVLLSEAPPDDWLERLAADFGPDGRFVRLGNAPGDPYWFRLAVVARGPVTVERRLTVPAGAGVVVSAGVRGSNWRITLVDGRSDPRVWRTPFLRALADACGEASDAGRPFDLVAGDFNCVGRSLGFDDFRARGFRPASASTVGWRGTFPSVLPLYDIDHVWAGPGVVACDLFRGPHTDHRGQVARVVRPR